MKKKIILIIDTEGKGPLWGRVLYEDNLLVDSGKTVSQIETKMKKLLINFHQLKSVELISTLLQILIITRI